MIKEVIKRVKNNSKKTTIKDLEEKLQKLEYQVEQTKLNKIFPHIEIPEDDIPQKEFIGRSWLILYHNEIVWNLDIDSNPTEIKTKILTTNNIIKNLKTDSEIEYFKNRLTKSSNIKIHVDSELNKKTLIIEDLQILEFPINFKYNYFGKLI